MNTNHNMNLLFKMIFIFLCIFIGIWIFATYKIFPLANDVGATLASCLSAGATIYAALVAYLLLDNWKIEHKYQLTSTYFQKTFNSYKNLKEALSELQNHHDSWLEKIYRAHGEINDFEDGGLISKVSIAKKTLGIFVNRIESYSIIFKDKSLDIFVGEVNDKLKKILDPLLEEYHEMEGQIDSKSHLKSSECLKNEISNFLIDYDEKIQKLLASKIVF